MIYVDWHIAPSVFLFSQSGADRRQFLGVQGGTPQVWLDGVLSTNGDQGYAGYAQQAATRQMAATGYELVATFSIDEMTREGTFEFTVMPAPPQGLSVRGIVMEHGIPYLEQTWDHVGRVLVEAQVGPGRSSTSITVPLDATWDLERLTAVGLLQGTAGGEILAAARAGEPTSPVERSTWARIKAQYR